MPTFLQRIENTIGGLLSSLKERDAKLFLKSAPFASFPTSSIDVFSPELGQDKPTLTVDHSPLGANLCPALSWTYKGTETPVEYVVVIEDPDAPLPSPVVHGIYYGIPASKTAIAPDELVAADVAAATTKGEFHYGANRMGTVYGGARPPIGHGVHRYFFQVVALGEALGVDVASLKGKKLSKVDLEVLVAGKVLGWGEYTALYERTLPA